MSSADPSDLAVASRFTLLRRVAVAVLVVALIGFAGWYLTHPQELPTSDRRVDASTPAQRPVFIGVFSVPADFGRTLDVRGVRVHATATTPVRITPRLCRSGSIGATREPEPFCAELLGTEGVSLGPGDQVVLEVESEGAGIVAIDPVELAYSEGLQRGVQPAGSRALVTFLRG